MKAACLKHLGTCLCPQCLTEKSQVPQVATPADMERRQNERVDTTARQAAVEKARKLIFLEGHKPSSKAVEDILNPTSSLPVHVRTSTAIK